jgi:adenylate cyclase
VSLLSARKLWRALGFPGVSDDAEEFTLADRDALARVVQLVRENVVDEETAIAVARALGQSTDRLVSWQTEALNEFLAAQRVADGAAHDPFPVIERLTEDLERLLVYSFRRQLAAAVARMDGDNGPEVMLTVGFADLVSYTRLARRLAQRELSRLVQRFEGLAADVITTGGGRVVKTVGDEVLFVADNPVSGAVIALSLAEQLGTDELLPEVRVGLAHGPVLRSLGDVYGSTVNLASRLTAIAQPGSVMTDPRTARELQNEPEIMLVAQRRRPIRDFGQIEPVLIAAAPGTIQLITVD